MYITKRKQVFLMFFPNFAARSDNCKEMLIETFRFARKTPKSDKQKNKNE